MFKWFSVVWLVLLTVICIVPPNTIHWRFWLQTLIPRPLSQFFTHLRFDWEISVHHGHIVRLRCFVFKINVFKLSAVACSKLCSFHAVCNAHFTNQAKCLDILIFVVTQDLFLGKNKWNQYNVHQCLCLWLNNTKTPNPRAFVLISKLWQMPHSWASLRRHVPHGGASERVQMTKDME